MSAFNEYQEATRRTANDNPRNNLIFALGLCGEAGEVAELVKKFEGHGITYGIDKMKKELGDVLFYLSRLADDHGLTLQEVADENITKLKARYPNGFVPGGGIR